MLWANPGVPKCAKIVALKCLRSQTGHKYLTQFTEGKISWKGKTIWFNENYKGRNEMVLE